MPATTPRDSSAAPALAERASLSDRAALGVVAFWYLTGAVLVTWWLWRDPASRIVAGNPNDADQMAWFFRYDATAIQHLKLPSLVTTGMNAPHGVNVMWNTFMLLPGAVLTDTDDTWVFATAIIQVLRANSPRGLRRSSKHDTDGRLNKVTVNLHGRFEGVVSKRQ